LIVEIEVIATAQVLSLTIRVFETLQFFAINIENFINNLTITILCGQTSVLFHLYTTPSVPNSERSPKLKENKQGREDGEENQWKTRRTYGSFRDLRRIELEKFGRKGVLLTAA